MNAPTCIDPLAIPEAHIHAAIAALVALAAKPSRDSYAWYRALVTFDRIEGRDGLADAIGDAEYDLGLGDADEPLETVLVRGEGFDADQVVRSSYGLWL